MFSALIFRQETLEVLAGFTIFQLTRLQWEYQTGRVDINNEVTEFLLNKAYPSPKGKEKDLLVSLLFGGFIALFLLFFEPFDLNVLAYENKKLTISFFGIITAVVFICFLYLAPRVFPKVFHDKHWKVKHQILLYAVILFVIATLNGFYINYLNELAFSWPNYWWIILRTYAIGILPITFLTLIDYNKKLNTHVRIDREVNGRAMRSDALKERGISIILEQGKTHIRIEAENFLYVRADGNYISLYQIEAEQLKKQLYRASLNTIEKQLTTHHIQRCHRSYVVNLQKVSKVTGNAQGLKLEMDGVADPVPVSRKYVARIRSYFMP